MVSFLLSRRAVLAGSMAFACALAGQTAYAAPQVLRVGIMAGEDEDVWPVVAANAARDGLELKLVTFSDYNAPNEALAEHELDANAFQHTPFLDAQNKA
ncbi:MAG: MetQ/NlpA family ABC transporter substrate-binding protein, partial [Acetobacter sp.]